MNLKNLSVALLAALLVFSSATFAQNEAPVAQDAAEDARPAPPPPAEGEETDEKEKPIFMPTGKIAGAYEPTAAERNEKTSAQSLKIAENGRALVPIVVSTRALTTTRNAAIELAGYLEKITGAKFEIQYGDAKPFDYPVVAYSASAGFRAQKEAIARDEANKTNPADPLPQNGIVLGTAAEFEVPADLKEGLAMRGAFHGREAFAIRTNSRRTVLLANQDRGLSHLVTRFLEELGCRWFGPGEHWAVFPKAPDLNFGKDITDRPSIGSRIIAFMDGAMGAQERQDQSNWARRNYVGTSFSAGVGHMWSKIIALHQEEIKQHPEYMALVGGKRREMFAKGPDGKDFIPIPTLQSAKLEMGNPIVRQWFVDYAISFFKQFSDADMVGVSPNDAGGYSQSPESQKLGDGGPSDQVFTMVNEVARALQKEFPGQGKMVGCYAYRDAAAPPSFPLEDNVYVEVALGYNQSKYTTAQLAEMWPEKVKNMGVYEYISIYDAGGSGIPGGAVSNIPRLVGAIRQHYAHNVASFFAQSSNAFAMQMRGYLVTTRLMWNPNADWEAILADFYEKSFGSAKAPMIRFYERLSYTNPRPINEYTLAAAYRDLDEATKLAQGRDDILWRLADLKTYLRFNSLIKEWQATPAKDPQFAPRFILAMQKGAQLAPAYMQQWNMASKRLGRVAPKTITAEIYKDLPPLTLEGVEADFQADLKKQPTRDIVYVDFDQTDLVPIEWGPLQAPEVFAPIPPRVGEGPPMHFEYYQGATPIYNFYSWKGEPIAVELIAGMRGSGQSGRIQTWMLRQTDGKGGWKPIAKGEVPTDQSVQKLSIPVPGPGSYGFVMDFGSLAGRIYTHADRPLTLVATGAKDYYGPFFYVPKGTGEIWVQYNSFGGGDLGIIQPDGKPLAKPLVNGVYTIAVPPGMDGKVWRVGPRSRFRGQTFFNIPNLAAPSVDDLMVPRALAIKDGLKIREK